MRIRIGIGLAAFMMPTLAFATPNIQLTTAQRDYWENIQRNWHYADKQLALLSAETSTTETLCPPSWKPDYDAVYHTRLTFSFIEHGVRRYCEVCISDRSRSFRPIDKPQSGTQ